MAGGFFFPPMNMRNSSEEDGLAVERFRALAGILPVVVLGTLVIVCLYCAEWWGKRKQKPKKREPRPPEPPRDIHGNLLDPSQAALCLQMEETLTTPTGSPEEKRPFYDPMNFSFGYGNNSMINSPIYRSVLEDTYVAPKKSPAQSLTTPFAKVVSTPPVLFKKKKEEEHGDESRSPSPTTLIRRGKEERYGAWLRCYSSSSSSGTSDGSQTTAFPFHMDLDHIDYRWLSEREKRERQRKKLLSQQKKLEREKKRLKKEKMEEQAQIIRDQINWTEKDERDRLRREARAVNIPPRERMEDHRGYQRMMEAMLDEKNATFDAKTVLNSAWERRRLIDFLRENRGFEPDWAVAVDKGESARHSRAKKKVRFVAGEAGQHGGARRKVKVSDIEAKGKAALRQAARRKVREECEPVRGAAQLQAVKRSYKTHFWHSIKPALVPITEDKEEPSPPPLQEDDKTKLLGSEKGTSTADDSRPLILQHGEGIKRPSGTEAEHQFVRKAVPDPKDSQPGKDHHEAVGGKKRKASVDISKPLFSHYGAGKNYGSVLSEVHPMGVITSEMLDASSPFVVGKELEERRLAETRAVSSKIAKAVFDIEMKRIEEQLSQSRLKEGELHHVVEIHSEPQTSGLPMRKMSPIVEEPDDEMQTKPSISESARRKQTPIIKEHVEIHPEPSSLELAKKPPSPIVEEPVHPEPSTSGFFKRLQSPAVEKHVVDIHPEPSTSASVRRETRIIKEHVEIHPEPQAIGLVKRHQSPAVAEHVVEVHPEPSASGLMRRRQSPAVAEHAVEIHPEPSASGLMRRRQSPAVAEHAVEIHPEPSASGLMRRRQSPAVAEHVEIHRGPSASVSMRRRQSPAVAEHVDEIHPEPSASGVVRRKQFPVVEKDTVIDIGENDPSSSWEDISPFEYYIGWPGKGDQKKGERKKYSEK